MTTTYDCIATTTLSSNQSSVTFSSISGTYTDLVLISNSKAVSTNDNYRITINDDNGSTYSYTFVSGNGSTTSSNRSANANPMYLGNLPATDWSVNIAHIMNYSNTTTFKTVISRSGGAATADAFVNMWRSTNAITKIKVDIGTGNFASGSTFTLYGIKAE